mgnify:CR=1 FL=1
MSKKTKAIKTTKVDSSVDMITPFISEQTETIAAPQPQITTEIPKILIGVPILSWSHEFATSFLNFWTGLMTYQKGKRKFHI